MVPKSHYCLSMVTGFLVHYKFTHTQWRLLFKNLDNYELIIGQVLNLFLLEDALIKTWKMLRQDLLLTNLVSSKAQYHFCWTGMDFCLLLLFLCLSIVTVFRAPVCWSGSPVIWFWNWFFCWSSYIDFVGCLFICKLNSTIPQPIVTSEIYLIRLLGQNLYMYIWHLPWSWYYHCKKGSAVEKDSLLITVRQILDVVFKRKYLVLYHFHLRSLFGVFLILKDMPNGSGSASFVCCIKLGCFWHPWKSNSSILFALEFEMKMKSLCEVIGITKGGIKSFR